MKPTRMTARATAALAVLLGATALGAQLSTRATHPTDAPAARAAIDSTLTEKAKACPPGAETCLGVTDTGIGYWKNDVRGAVVYATWKLMQRPGVKVTHMFWNFMDLVAGQQLQLTNPDGSRTFASIYMHENKLLTMEGTVKAGLPEPGLFQQSLGWLDEQGNGVRYEFVYYNDPDLNKPNIRRRTPQQRNDGRIDAPGAPGAQAR